MKKFLICIFLFISFATTIFAARTSTKRTTSSRNSSSVKKYSLPSKDECIIDIDYCFNRYCFDKKTLSNGVYSKCGAEPASRILINVEDCLKTRSVIKELDFEKGCVDYSYNRVVDLLANKDVIEVGLKKNTKECEKATKALQAAKQCYAAMISSDGSYSVDLYDTLDKLCGFEVSGDSYMLNRFFEAGDYGEANLQAISDLELTGQNTVKRENWRQVVDATLAGYTEIAELACGEENYKMTKVNDYALDSRENSQMVMLKAQAAEMGKQTANRIVNSWFRETDCVNSPLPVGGLYWDYEKGGNPDCKIVCKEGYAIGSNSSECVKIEKENSSEVFMGLNIDNDWIGQNSLKKNETSEQIIVPIAKIDNDTNQLYSSNNDFSNDDYSNDDHSIESSSSTCSKQLERKWYADNSVPTAQEICRVFFPKCTSESLGSKMYYENTGSYFCIGKNKGTFDNWVALTVPEIKNAFTGYKNESNLFGNNYSQYLSKYLVDNCRNYCGKVDNNPKVDEEDDSNPKVDEEPVSDDKNISASCRELKGLIDNVQYIRIKSKDKSQNELRKEYASDIQELKNKLTSIRDNSLDKFCFFNYSKYDFVIADFNHFIDSGALYYLKNAQTSLNTIKDCLCGGITTQKKTKVEENSVSDDKNIPASCRELKDLRDNVQDIRVKSKDKSKQELRKEYASDIQELKNKLTSIRDNSLDKFCLLSFRKYDFVIEFFNQFINYGTVNDLKNAQTSLNTMYECCVERN